MFPSSCKLTFLSVCGCKCIAFISFGNELFSLFFKKCFNYLKINKKKIVYILNEFYAKLSNNCKSMIYVNNCKSINYKIIPKLGKFYTNLYFYQTLFLCIFIKYNICKSMSYKDFILFIDKLLYGENNYKSIYYTIYYKSIYYNYIIVNQLFIFINLL